MLVTLDVSGFAMWRRRRPVRLRSRRPARPCAQGGTRKGMVLCRDRAGGDCCRSSRLLLAGFWLAGTPGRCGRIRPVQGLAWPFSCRRDWCGREDSNFHGLSPTTTSTLRVYQFRHDRIIDKGLKRPSRVGAGH